MFGTDGRLARVFRFPDPVNEVSARLVAGGVVFLTLTTIVLAEPWLLLPLAYGFVARVLSGPTLSPLGQVATRLLTPLVPVPARYVPGPPKRFAQGIGAVLSLGAVVAHLAWGATDVAYVLVGFITAAATLESVLGYCAGCRMFALLMRAGVISESVCESCSDLWNSKTVRPPVA